MAGRRRAGRRPCRSDHRQAAPRPHRHRRTAFRRGHHAIYQPRHGAPAEFLGVKAQAALGRTSRSIVAPLCVRAFVKSCIACRLIQNSALVPRKRASRSAVSAVTERSPLTIAPTRVAGTRNANASALTERPRGFRNSSSRTSPGCVVTRLGVPTPLVIVDDFDIRRALLGPHKADAPLVVDPDRMLSATISAQSFQPVRWRYPQVVEIERLMEHVELP